MKPFQHRYTWTAKDPLICTTCSRHKADHPEPVKAIRNRQRGAHHRPVPGPPPAGSAWLTDCGRVLVDVEVVDLERAAKEDGCRKCFRRKSDRP